jgi:hypothetical protein
MLAPAVAVALARAKVMRRIGIASCGLFAAFALCAPRSAHADAIAACVSAATSGQKLQRSGQLLAARAAFLACDKGECPGEVRAVCDRLLGTVESSLPTVIFGAKDSKGGDLIAVHVRVDGVLVAESMDGRAVPMDPGPHQLLFESEGSTPIAQSVVVREAEKNRPLGVTFPVTEAKPKGPAPAAAPRGAPVLAYALGGVGLASLGTFVGLDVSGQSRFASCQSHPCSTSTVDSLEVERAAAWATAGVGVALVGSAVWLLLTRHPEPAGTARVDIGVGGWRDGAFVRAIGAF